MTKTAIDEHFIARVYRTSAWVWAIGLLAALSVGSYHFAIGWTVGSAMSVGILRSLDYIIRRTVVPGAGPGARSSLAKFSLVKLVAVGIILSAVIYFGGRSFALVAGFCAGLILTQAVIVLKTIGLLILERLNS